VEPGKEELEHFLVRRREVDVAAPDPVSAARARVVDHAGWLWVVDDDEVEGIVERLGVLQVVAPEDLLLRFGQRPRGSLERVVDRLRDVEELVCRRGSHATRSRGRRRAMSGTIV
jgi:hypothetical protein